MDEKERWLIEQARTTIDTGTFSEWDVLGLLIMLRRHAPPNSAILELADFVAHRERDKGILKMYLNRIQTALKSNTSPRGQQTTFPVFTSTDIYTAFNMLFTSLGFSPIDVELGNRLSVCIITLLQSVKVNTPLMIPTRGFIVGMSSYKIALMGLAELPAGHIVKFPLLMADNNGYEVSLAMAPHPVESLIGGDLLVEAYCQGGVFRVQQRNRPA
jgi:hypothetical protein